MVSTSFLGQSYMMKSDAISKEVSCEDTASFEECKNVESLGCKLLVV